MTYTELVQAVQGDLARMDLDFLHRQTDHDYHQKVNLIVLMVLGLTMKYGDVIPTKED